MKGSRQYIYIYIYLLEAASYFLERHSSILIALSYNFAAKGFLNCTIMYVVYSLKQTRLFIINPPTGSHVAFYLHKTKIGMVRDVTYILLNFPSLKNEIYYTNVKFYIPNVHKRCNSKTSLKYLSL